MAAWVRLEFQHVTVECALFTHVLVWGGKVPRLKSAHSTVVCGVAAVSACYLPLFKPWPIRTHTRHIEYVGQYLCYARTPHIERISCGAALLRVCLECYCGVGRPLNICQTPCTQRPSQEHTRSLSQSACDVHTKFPACRLQHTVMQTRKPGCNKHASSSPNSELLLHVLTG